jgi:hypothetical protein
MPHAEAKRIRDRWESDLLLNVVFAHMAFSSTKDSVRRDTAHQRFKNAVRELHVFLTSEEEENAEDLTPKA